MSASSVEAFSGAGEKVGVVCWRIEKFNPVKQDALGLFSEGDSYICLNTYTKSNSKKYNIHFWLGKDTSKDEAGTAAVLSSVLDEQLGGLAVQYRELQGKESSVFLQLFPKGVQYIHGGVDSGFTHVEEGNYEPKLLHIRGKRNVRVVEVPLSAASLNSGDCFVLDDGLALFQWNGKEANTAEKSKAIDVTMRIKNDLRSGKPMVFVVEEGEGSDEEKAFFEKLGVDDPSKVKISASIKPSSESLFAPPVLYKATGGSYKEVAKDRLEKSMLTSDGVFILQTSVKIMVWLGKDAPNDEKKDAFAIGTKFLASKKLKDDTEIEVVKEKLEDPLFKQNFHQWEDDVFRSTFETAKVAEAESKTPEVDLASMVAGKTGKAAKEMKVDDGSGTVKVWRVEDYKLKPLPEEEYGLFFAGDSYVIHYSYRRGGSQNHIIYYWQGRDSSADEKGTAAALAAAMDEELGGMPVQVRVVQNKEPNHFFRIFQGGMIVSLGGLKNEDEGKEGPNGEKLYHVKATDEFDTHAVQVTTSALSLNSGDSFVMVDKDSAVVWHGNMSSENEKKYADMIVSKLSDGKPTTTISEGQEDGDFWEKLGGKAVYPKIGVLPPPEMPPRLFQVSDSTTGGTGIVVEEIFNFDQEDLNDNDVMLLDVYREIYLWVGKDARAEEKKAAADLAVKYLEQASKTTGRDPDVPVTEIKSGKEPPMFTCHFLGWDDTRNADFVDPYKEKLKKLKSEQGNSASLAKLAEARRKAFKDPLEKKPENPPPPPAAEPVAPSTPPPAQGLKYLPNKDVFTCEQLKGMKGEDGIDASKKEAYLSDDEFNSLFKMSKAEFNTMAAWKQTRSKKDVGLF